MCFLTVVTKLDLLIVVVGDLILIDLRRSGPGPALHHRVLLRQLLPPSSDDNLELLLIPLLACLFPASSIRLQVQRGLTGLLTIISLVPGPVPKSDRP